MDAPKIVITGAPAWADDLSRTLADLGYAPVGYGERNNYIPRLTDDHAALVLVDGDHADWQFFTTSPKVNAATRRIPVVVVTADGDTARDAYTAGADLVLTPADLPERIGVVINDYARVQPDAEANELANQCAQSLPELARKGIEQFNNGAYYRQHDSFEELWMAEAGPVRDLYRAILQVGVAYYQVTRNNRRGALKMILRSIQWLNILPDVCQGVDVARLRADALRLRAYLESLPEGADLQEYPDDLLGRVYLVE